MTDRDHSIGAHRILVGDVRRRLRDLPDGSYQCVVTSPPYWGLRDYQTDGQIGLEESVEGYVAAMVEVFREVRRVLRDDGVLFLNLGDSYAVSEYRQRNNEGAFSRPCRDGVYQTGRKPKHGVKPKDLIGVPWMVATALRADGWWLRAAMPWLKRNPMPDSVTDRPGSGGVETVFMLAKRPRYFYDAVAVRRAATSAGGGACFGKQEQDADGTLAQSRQADPSERNCEPGKRSFRCSDLFYSTFPRAMGLVSDDDGTPTALDVNPRGFKEAHFATFPPELVEPLIQAGTSERGCCPACGAAWVRVTEKRETGATQKACDSWDSGPGGHGTIHRDGRSAGERGVPVTIEVTTGWTPSCACDAEPVPSRVLDPFAGSGTVGAVCEELGRVFDGIELNPEYAAMAEQRIRGSLEAAGLFGVGQEVGRERAV